MMSPGPNLPSLPPGIPGMSSAKLPAVYSNAKTALEACSRVDECKGWADKAQALASYAKQADDDSLYKMAVRIQARAIRRAGELLQEIIPAKNQHDAGKRVNSAHAASGTSRSKAAADAGMSTRQQHTATRVAKVPKAKFEKAVESDNPPTVTKLARDGTQTQKRPLIDLEGRDPAEFQKATQVQGSLREFAKLLADRDVAVVVRGSFHRELIAMKRQASVVTEWLERLRLQIDEERK